MSSNWVDVVPTIRDFVVLAVGVGFTSAFNWIRVKPRLTIGGGGGSGGQDKDGRRFSTGYISIYNDPSFFGFRVKRDPVEINSATLTELGSTSVIGGRSLVWLDRFGRYKTESGNIDSGEHADLVVASKYNGEEGYFIANNFDGDGRLIPGYRSKYNEIRKVFTLNLQSKTGKVYVKRIVIIDTESNVCFYYNKSIDERFHDVKYHIRGIFDAIFRNYYVR